MNRASIIAVLRHFDVIDRQPRQLSQNTQESGAKWAWLPAKTIEG
jgi:hypothetical protein